MFDVAIIGCGITGASAAYELSRYRLRVAIIEQENDISMGTTKANSAIVHAGYDPEPGTLMAKLNREGTQLMGQLCRELDVPYLQTGSLVLAFTEEELPKIRELYQRGVQNGVPGLELLTPEQVKIMEPNLSPVAGALYAPTAGIVSPWELALALTETAVQNGTELFLSCPVTAITKEQDGFSITAGEKDIRARRILNAAGVSADIIHNLVAKPSFTIVPDRGEYYLLDKSEGNQVSHVVFQCPTKAGKGTLVAPTVHGNLIVGPNNEPPESPNDLSTTRAGLEQVARNARKSLPNLNLRQSIRNFAGIRAAADRDDFIIESAADVPDFIDLAGIKSPGLTCAPAIGKMAVYLLEQSGLSLAEKEQFVQSRRRIRFAHLSTEEKARLIQENPDYGRVICRCETVTEGEIRDSFSSPVPPRSIDAVKRRTNAGMGRCQGSFCSPRILELLAEHWNVSPDQVPQDGEGTNILMGETKGGSADE